MRVLIADDHPLYREAAALQIRRLYLEAQVQEVASLSELHAAADQAPDFDLILVDYHMPGMSAAALAGLVQEFPPRRWPSYPAWPATPTSWLQPAPGCAATFPKPQPRNTSRGRCNFCWQAAPAFRQKS